MKLLAIVLAVGLGFVSAVRYAAAAEGEGGGTPTKGNQIYPEKLEAVRREAAAKSGIQPREDEEVSLLVYRALNQKQIESRLEQVQAVLALDRDRVVAALAHGILDMERGAYCVHFVAEYLPDKRLVPFLAARIRLSQGRSLHTTLKLLHLAPNDFLRGLVPVLIEHALNSDYGGIIAPGRHPMFYSTLVETARLLDKITEGKTGIKPVVDYAEFLFPPQEGEAKRAELRAAWCKWWAANKDNWPPKEEAKPEAQKEPPPQEVPEVPDKGQADEPAPDPTKDAGQPAQPAPAN
jgi:hypothetical protein